MASTSGPLPGAYVQPNETHIQDLGKCAISTYNKQSGATLHVARANYKLAIQALEDPFVHTWGIMEREILVV
ncbi:hypothetical protein AMTRI_Chr02g216470 [Amborella trichopoda]